MKTDTCLIFNEVEMLWGEKIIFYLLTVFLSLSLFGVVGQIVGNVFVGQKAVKVQMIQIILKDKSNESVFAAFTFSKAVRWTLGGQFCPLGCVLDTPDKQPCDAGQQRIFVF